LTNGDAQFGSGDTGITEYQWDHRNRLTKVTDRATYTGSLTQTVDYTYDAFDRLIGRSFDADGAGGGSAVDSYYFYDGGEIALDFDGLTAADLTHRYLHGTAVDQVLADDDGAGNVLWPLEDHEGTIRDLVNSSGTVTNHRVFDAFGNVASETNGAVDHLFAFTGQMLDEATALQTHLHRWYDPAVGRWLSEDPIGFAGGDANLYRYSANSPLNYVDPSGLGYSGVAGALWNAASSIGQSFASAATSTAQTLYRGASTGVQWAATNYATNTPVFQPGSTTLTQQSLGNLWNIDRGTAFSYISTATQQDFSHYAQQAASSNSINAAAGDAAVRDWQARELARVQQYGQLPPGFGPMDFAIPDSRMPFSASPFPIPIGPAGGAGAAVGYTVLGAGAVAVAGPEAAAVGLTAYNEFGYAAGAIYYSAPAWTTSPLTWGAVAGVGVGGYTYYQTGDAGSSLESGLQAGAIPLLMMPGRASGDLAGAYMRLRNPVAPPVLSPYQVHINPSTGVGPMAIDSTTFTSGKPTTAGGIENSRQFWTQWSSTYGDTLSAANQRLISQGLAPVVDGAWTRQFPEHAPYLDQILIHHHLDYGPMAIPLPEPIHVQQPGRSIWHQ
jgi:RHS repeat-associated protein